MRGFSKVSNTRRKIYTNIITKQNSSNIAVVGFMIYKRLKRTILPHIVLHVSSRYKLIQTYAPTSIYEDKDISEVIKKNRRIMRNRFEIIEWVRELREWNCSSTIPKVETYIFWIRIFEKKHIENGYGYVQIGYIKMNFTPL